MVIVECSWHRGPLLRVRSERPRGRRAPEQRDELAAALPKLSRRGEFPAELSLELGVEAVE